MNITAYYAISGVPATGLSPTIKIRDVSDGSLIVNAAAMTELGDGFYAYDFTTYEVGHGYAVICDAGSTLTGTERYVQTSIDETATASTATVTGATGTILASAIITRLRTILQDTDSDMYQWSDSTFLDYINDGQRAIVLLKPNANVTNTAVQLVAGTKQSLPTGGVSLVKVTRNMGSAGATAGRVINFIPMEQYNYLEPTWHSQDATPIVEAYTYDEDDPTHFYVAPPQPNPPHYVEMVYAATPTDIATSAAAITLNDIYVGALTNYALYRAYATETDQLSASLSEKYYNLFVTELGRKDLVEQKNPTKKG